MIKQLTPQLRETYKLHNLRLVNEAEGAKRLRLRGHRSAKLIGRLTVFIVN